MTRLVPYYFCGLVGFVVMSLRKREMPAWLFVGWLVVLGLTALRDSISVYIGTSPKERETEERMDR